MTKFTRLYESFQPNNYNLELSLERRARKFSGKVVITGTLTNLDSVIKLHAKELKITGAIVNDIPADTKAGKNDELIITPSSQLIDKDITISLTFTGKITDPMNGIYPCYFEHEGAKKELLMTQFEPFHAHKVFPCIDEPEAKATFDLTLKTENKVEVLSNMPVKSQQEKKHNLITSFETTPVMSSYLLAFVVGELHKVSGKTKDGVEVNTWATPAHKPESLSFSLDVAIRAIEFFSDYFGTPYPLPKSDHVAVPDFSAGAMENWGLITYREVCLIVDKSTATSTKQHSATVIAHEVSHQWFGNLVTMRWWDDLWLNESFANMMEYVAVDALFPEWKIWNEFASYESLASLRRDSLPGVQSVKLPVNHPDEIGTLFDPAIVYAKGGKLLNMLRNFIGEEAFVEGLRMYFKKHAYSNTSGSDLWAALGESSGQDIGTFMSEWLEKSGFPVIEAQIKNNDLVITQNHFLIGGKADERSWPVPLAANIETVPKLLSERSVEAPCYVETLIINKDDISYFITKYDDKLQKRILENLDDLSDIDRLKLLNDANLLSRGLLKPAADLVDLLIAYENEKTQPVWSLMSLIVADLKRFTDQNETDEKQLKTLVNHLCTPLYRELGWETAKDEDEQITKLRSIIIGLMIYAENDDAIEIAIKKYTKANDDLSQLDSELRTSILVAAVRHSKKPSEVVDSLLEYHNATSSSDLKSDICSAVSGTRDPNIGEGLLALFTDNSIIKPQDLLAWFAYMIRNRHCREITWQWMIDNWDWIESTFEDDHHYDSFARYTASTFATAEYEEKYRAFFTPKINEIELKRTIEIGLDEIAGRRSWIESNREEVAKRLHSI